MHVFYLTTELPFPPTGGGRVRSLAELRLIASLPEVESVRVLALHEGDVSPRDARALEAAVPKVSVAPLVFHPIHVFRHPRHVPRLLLVRLGKRVPYLAAKWDGRALRKAIVAELAARAYGVVYLDHLGMAMYLPEVRQALPGARVVLEQHNVESDFFRQFAQEAKGKRALVRPIAYLEWQKARAFEAESLQQVDAAVAISKDDANAFEALARVRAHVVPQAVPFTPKPVDAPAPVSPREVGYVGSLSWRPNAQGLDWICREVWPLVRAAAPELTLSIVGSGLAEKPEGGPVVPLAWQVDGVRTLGFVRELGPHEQRWSAMVAPVFGGSGVRIKLLESFKAGVPVVTTPDGAAGLDLEDGRELFIAKTAADFAKRVVELAGSPELQARLRAGAYAYLERAHAPRVAQAVMRAALGLPSLPSAPA
jgi:glycosyltransferase involved in cell wall biosynthesis